MNNKPQVTTVALDVDEVVCDFITGFITLAHQLGYKYLPLERKEIKSWDWNGMPEKDFSELWNHVLKYPSFWLSLPTRPEIPDVDGIIYVTSRPVPSYVTKTWMHINKIPFAQVYTVSPGRSKIGVLQSLRFQHGIKYFADDKPENFEDAQKVFGDGAFLFDAPHNQDYATDKRIHSVYQIPDLMIHKPTAQRMAA